jgi:hypothetical protein
VLAAPDAVILTPLPPEQILPPEGVTVTEGIEFMVIVSVVVVSDNTETEQVVAHL